jgi:hypothetical protein
MVTWVERKSCLVLLWCDQCCGSTLVSLRIWIQLFTPSMRIRFRIQVGKPVRTHPDPGQTLSLQKAEFLQTSKVQKAFLKLGLFVNSGQFPCS